MNEKYGPMLIGIINFSESVLSEGSVGSINLGKRIGACKVYVYPNEGPVPHFHLLSESNDFESCICIYSNNYFDHGSKIGILNSKQRKELNDWLKSDASEYSTVKGTYWDLIAVAWRMNNGDKYIPKVQKMPDYLNLANFRSR